jgi:hypothetical protein
VTTRQVGSIALLSLAVTAGASIAMAQQDRGAPPRAPRSGVIEPMQKTSLGALQKSYSASHPGAFNTGSKTFVNITSASFVDDVGGDANVGYHVTLTGLCFFSTEQSPGDHRVFARVLVNQEVIGPSKTTLCQESAENAVIPTSAQWVVKSIPPGANTIRVQMAVQEGVLGFLENWHLTVRRHASN